jgi:ABC-type polysaccharide transport system permease subunit
MVEEQKNRMEYREIQSGLMELLVFLFIIGLSYLSFYRVVIALLNYRPCWALSDCKIVGLKNNTVCSQGSMNIPWACETRCVGILGIWVVWTGAVCRHAQRSAQQAFSARYSDHQRIP